MHLCRMKVPFNPIQVFFDSLFLSSFEQKLNNYFFFWGKVLSNESLPDVHEFGFYFFFPFFFSFLFIFLFLLLFLFFLVVILVIFWELILIFFLIFNKNRCTNALWKSLWYFSFSLLFSLFSLSLFFSLFFLSSPSLSFLFLLSKKIGNSEWQWGDGIYGICSSWFFLLSLLSSLFIPLSSFLSSPLVFISSLSLSSSFFLSFFFLMWLEQNKKRNGG